MNFHLSKQLRRVLAPLTIFTSLAAGSYISHAQAAGVTDLRTSPDGYAAVVKAAQTTADKGIGLAYTSNAPEDKSFSFDFTPTSANDRLAIFSDDGCDVSAQDVTSTLALKDRDKSGLVIRLLSVYGAGQSLPVLSQSLHPLTYEFVPNRLYKIYVHYSNVIYTAGASDIDGLALYAYTDNAPITPKPPRTPVTLNADRITDVSARLYWTQVNDSDFASYSLFFSTAPITNANLASATKLVDASAKKDLTEFTKDGLTAETTYYFWLRVRYTTGSPFDTQKQVKTKEPNVPQLKFTTALRACAGHINTDVHKVSATVPVTIKDSKGVEGAAKATKFTLKFENNTSGDKGARFLVTEAGKEVEKEQIDVTSTNDPAATTATVSFLVLSSNVIGTNVQVKAIYTDTKGKEHDAGSGELDFARVEQGDASGKKPNWVFSKDYIVTPNNSLATYSGTTYLRFSKEGAYVPVGGHKVRIKIGDITANPNMSAPPKSDATVFFVDGAGPPANTGVESGEETVDAVSGPDGAVTFSFKAGPQVMQAGKIKFKAVEKTQIKG